MMAEIGWGQITLAVLVTIVSFLLICLVLLQKNRGSGLSGAFGGAGGQSAFGTKTGDVLTWITVGLTAVFLLLCVAGNWMFVPSAESAAISAPDSGQQAPAGPTAPAPTTPGKSRPLTNKPMQSKPLTLPPGSA